MADTEAERIAEYIALLIICVATLVGTLCKTIKTIRANPTIYTNIVLLLLYISILFKLLYAVFQYCIIAFSLDGKLNNIRSGLAVVESVFTSVSIYISLERMLSILNSLNEEPKPYIPIMTKACWVFMVLHMAAQVISRYTFDPDERSELITRSRVDSFTAFGTFLYMGVVFLVFAYGMLKYNRMWVLTQATMITAFFVVQMVGQLMYSVYCVVWMYDSRSFKGFDSAGRIVFAYALTFFVDLIPSVLIVIILSGSEEGDNAEEGEPETTEN